jgi:N-acetyl-anhydromuramyl-L-alanine amidase AmpD
VPARRWNYIVIHHSATTSGCAADFDAAHKRNGWDELGYHFVIGNGTDTRDGHVEVGPRWQKQKWGAHAKTSDNRFNQRGIGICLVGDFDHAHPTPRQLRALTQLTAYLMDRHGIPPQHVIGHRDTKPTACPGRHLDVARIRQSAAVAVAQARRANNTLAAANR